jgi:glycerol-3-phosphate acyltransferase PlsY
VNLALAAGLAVAGYLIGAISFARIIGARIAPGDDLLSTTLDLPGDATIDYGGVSATSIAVRGGPKWGVITGLLDMAKAFVPVLFTRLVWPDENYDLVVAVATVVGHNYPVYYRFKGGRGQTAIYGGLLAIDWIAIPVTTIVGTTFGLFVLRDMFAAYALGMWLLVPWFWWQADTAHVIYAVVVNLLFLVATIPEMGEYFQRRRNGELAQVRSWGDFKRSHPAVRGDQPKD